MGRAEHAAFHVEAAKVMRWVITGTIDPTKLEGVVSGRSGGSIMFVAYSRALRKWFWVIPRETEREIPEPEMILVDEQWRMDNFRSNPVQRESPPRVRKKKIEQLEFSL